MHRVFLVDDEPFILEGLKSIINWEEYDLEIAGQAINGADAFEQINSLDVDILITDIKMPKINGLQLIQNIKAINSQIKFIVLSGYNEFDYVKEGIKLGIENYLLKPVNTHELVSTLNNTLQKIKAQKDNELYFKKDFNILKDNILYRWVTNNIDIWELRERSQILDINLDCSAYSVSIAKAVFPPDWYRNGDKRKQITALNEIYGKCSSIVQQAGSGICFIDMEGNVVIIFTELSHNKLSKTSIYALLENIQKQIWDCFEVNLFITVGDFQSASYDVHKSYANAKKLQEYRLVSSAGRIIGFDDIIQKKYDIGTALPELDYGLLSRLVLARSKAEVFNFIDDLFNKLCSCQNVSPSDIHNYSIEMILHINKTVENYELNGSLSRSDYKKLFADMLGLDSIDRLKDYIKNIAGNAIDCFIVEDSTVSPVIKEVLKQIYNHYSEELSLKTLGQLFNINSTYLGQLFQKETGEHFSDYVNRFKMEKAKQLLLNTNLKAVEISKKVGFSDPAYFYRQFKKHFGITPVELRYNKP